jgi:GLPGLI family protein
MKTTLITTICLLLFMQISFAQNTHFTTSGIIEFDKSANMYAIVGKTITKDNEAYTQKAFEQYKKTQPQFKTLKTTLTFDKTKSLYAPTVVADAPTTNSFFFAPMADQTSTTYTDLTEGNSTSQKKFFEGTFLVKDTLRKIKWKITDETREIAGYPCRRANALILDSIYVVAFYTDKILVSGGPESFTGLPGMILGVALPHENVTWFATKVTDTSVPPNTIIPPKKGKVVTNKELRVTLEPVLKNAGPYAQAFYKAMAL